MTDHANLTYLKGSSDPKVLRWMVSIQEFDFTVRHIKGKDNVVADAFSRLCVLKGGPNTRKVSGQKRLQEDPAGEEGSRRSLRLALKKQTKETVPSGIEAP